MSHGSHSVFVNSADEGEKPFQRFEIPFDGTESPPGRAAKTRERNEPGGEAECHKAPEMEHRLSRWDPPSLFPTLLLSSI